jgi:hypothetical protein
MNWVRTRRLDLGRPSGKHRFRVFEDIGIEVLRDEENSHWIFFLIVSILSRWHGADGVFAGLSDSGVRRLYRFVCLGFRGFEE